MDSGLGASNTGEDMFQPASQRIAVFGKENRSVSYGMNGIEQEDIFTNGEPEIGEMEEPSSDETQLNSEDWLRIQNSPPSESLLTPRLIGSRFDSLSFKNSDLARSTKTDNNSAPMELTPTEAEREPAANRIEDVTVWTDTAIKKLPKKPEKVREGSRNVGKTKKIREAKENILAPTKATSVKQLPRCRKPLADITSKFVNMELHNSQQDLFCVESNYPSGNLRGSRKNSVYRDVLESFDVQEDEEKQRSQNEFEVEATVLDNALHSQKMVGIRLANEGTGTWMLPSQLGQNSAAQRHTQSQLGSASLHQLTNPGPMHNDSLGRRILDFHAAVAKPSHSISKRNFQGSQIPLVWPASKVPNIFGTHPPLGTNQDTPVYFIMAQPNPTDPENPTSDGGYIFGTQQNPEEHRNDSEIMILGYPAQPNPTAEAREDDDALDASVPDAGNLDHGPGLSEAVQTDLILPEDDIYQRQNVIKHVRLLRGLMNVKQYDVKFANSGKVKHKKRSSSTQYLRQGKQSASKNLEVEIIDLVSSPELETAAPCTKGYLQPRRLNFTKDNEKDNAENLRFALRNTDQREEALDSIKVVQAYVAAETMTRPAYVNDNWTGSLMELSCDTLMRVAEADECQGAGLVTRLCGKLLDTIEKEREGLQAQNHEGITNVLLKLCECLNVASDVVDRLIETISRIRETYMTHKDQLVPHIGLLENCYHFLRILNEILKRLEVNANQTGAVLRPSRTPQKDIMNLWRSHWRPNGAQDLLKEHPEHCSEHSERLVKLETLLKALLDNLPLFCPLVMQCMETARRIHMKATREV